MDPSQELNAGFTQGQQGTGINPAWNELLSELPEDSHSKVLPHLQKWDQNYQKNIGEVQSKYKDWDQWIEAGVEPDEVEFALGLLNAINEQPDQVRDALNAWIEQEGQGGNTQPPAGQAPNSGNGDQGFPEGFDLSKHPEFSRVSQAVEAMAEILATERQQKEQQAEEDELESQLNALRQKHGDFDEDFILAKMYSGMEAEKAYEAYNEFVEGIRTNSRRPPAPKVMGAGSAIPQQKIDPTKLDRQGTRNLVVEMLKNAMEQEQ